MEAFVINCFTLFQGYLVNWEIEKQVWDYVYGKNCMNVSWCLFQVVYVQNYHSYQEVQRVSTVGNELSKL